MKIELRKEQNLLGHIFYKVYLGDELVFDSVIYGGDKTMPEEDKSELFKKAIEIYENIKNSKTPLPQVLLSEDI